MIWTYYAQGDAPALPDWSVLADLSPPVALALLATVVVVTVLFHFGGVIRERLSRSTKTPRPEPVTAEQPAVQASSSALPQAVDASATMSNRFIDHLMQQIQAQDEDHDREKARLEQDLADARREIASLQVEVQRLNQMLWQRGHG